MGSTEARRQSSWPERAYHSVFDRFGTYGGYGGHVTMRRVSIMEEVRQQKRLEQSGDDLTQTQPTVPEPQQPAEQLHHAEQGEE